MNTVTGMPGLINKIVVSNTWDQQGNLETSLHLKITALLACKLHDVD